MKLKTRKIIAGLLGLWVVLTVGARAQDPRRSCVLTLFTANCYCFDEKQTRYLKNVTVLANAFSGSVDITDLQRGIQKSTNARREEIAREVIKSKADIALFQEVWNADNKTDITHRLHKIYKYHYVASHIKNNWKETDDGLLIVSKWVPFYTTAFSFSKKYDAEKYAHKGALLAAFYHPQGGFFLVVNTHMQSGLDAEAVSIREHQVGEIVRKIRELQRTDWRIQNATIIVGGDLNEPITLRANSHELFDRTRYLVQRFNDLRVPINNDQVINKLCRDYRVQKIIEIDQQADRGTLRTVGGGTQAIDPSNYGGGNWSYWRAATDPSGMQVLDHLFLDPAKARLEAMTVLRGPFLGDLHGTPTKDPNRAEPLYMNPDTAISDHAAVVYVIRLFPL